MAEWKTAKCPVCEKEYFYLREDERPKTCGSFNCIQIFFGECRGDYKRLKRIKKIKNEPETPIFTKLDGA